MSGSALLAGSSCAGRARHLPRSGYSSADFVSGARPLKDSSYVGQAGPSGSRRRSSSDEERDDRSDGEKEDDLLDGLDDDLELVGLREKRLEELRAECVSSRLVQLYSRGGADHGATTQNGEKAGDAGK